MPPVPPSSLAFCSSPPPSPGMHLGIPSLPPISLATRYHNPSDGRLTALLPLLPLPGRTSAGHDHGLFPSPSSVSLAAETAPLPALSIDARPAPAGAGTAGASTGGLVGGRRAAKTAAGATAAVASSRGGRPLLALHRVLAGTVRR